MDCPGRKIRCSSFFMLTGEARQQRLKLNCELVKTKNKPKKKPNKADDLRGHFRADWYELTDLSIRNAD